MCSVSMHHGNGVLSPHRLIGFLFLSHTHIRKWIAVIQVNKLYQDSDHFYFSSSHITKNHVIKEFGE